MPDREKAAQEDEAATDRLVVRMFKALWLVKKQHKHHRKEHR